LGVIAILLFSYLLILCNILFFTIYFRRVGMNIRSSELCEAAKVAMITWIVAIGTAIVCLVALFILAAAFKGEREKMRLVGDIVGVINVLLMFSVIGTLIAMAKTAIGKVCGR
jgi:Kef-type K+ transport system membrane component KefB